MIHNDFRFDNVVLDPNDPTRVIGVLDWEMATLGDPLMDLGSTLAYWVQADDDFFVRSIRRQPTHLPGHAHARARSSSTTAAGWAFSPADWRFYEVFGLFRLAVIAQQIYYRYHHAPDAEPRVPGLLAGRELPGLALRAGHPRRGAGNGRLARPAP